jgi:pimeloyl-ACP methyl ester carboxylesterase
MATFVLVHGSNVGGQVWRRVVPLLKDAGHGVFTPTLTGLGDEAHLLTEEVDLGRHIGDVVTVLDHHDLRDVILVGHSYAGIVITGVAERVPERLRHLVYLDAWAQQDGKSIAELAPAVYEAGREGREGAGPGWRWSLPNPEATLRTWGLTDAAEIRWWIEQLRPHPLRTFEEAVAAENPAAVALPKTFILCTAGKATESPFHRFAGHARSRPGWRYRELPSGHLPMSTMPAELVAVLLEVA